VGVRHALFPMPALGAFGGCRLPDAILLGKGSHRPRSRAVQRLAVAEFRVRPLSPLRLVVAPPAYGPGRDTLVMFASRLYHCAPGRPLRLAVRWPGATGLTSYLSGCILFTSQRCVFYIAGVLETSRHCLCPSASRCQCSFCLAFRRLSLGGHFFICPPESLAPC
jgi:hypothetical protein